MQVWVIAEDACICKAWDGLSCARTGHSIALTTVNSTADMRSQKMCLLLQGMEIPDPTGLIPANIENGLSVGTDALVMLGILIGMRVVAYVQMTLAIKFHKL